MTTYYTIVQLGYEYNDEIMYKPECGGGQPVSLFKSKKSAEDELSKLNQKEIVSLISDSCLYQYAYEWRELNVSEEIISSLDVSDDLYDFNKEAFENLTTDKKKLLIESINLSFYEIYEVEMKD